MNHFDEIKKYFFEITVQNSSNISYFKNNNSGIEEFTFENPYKDENFNQTAKKFYAIITPIIIVVGIVGNSFSLAVFCTKKLRNTSSSSCSMCLAALSLSDLLVIIFHVIIEWSIRGLPDFINVSFDQWKWANTDGICKVYLYVAYTLRMNSVGLIILFTLERYIVVCHPLQRNIICTKRRIRNCIICVFFISLILSSFKPSISDAKNNCGSSLRSKHAFILDTCYGMLLTAVPFVSIVTMNAFILRQLTSRSHKFAIKSPRGRNTISKQFGITMLALSSCFVLLNLPYFVIWCMRLLYTEPSKRLSALLQITRGIFHFNYCINFFLYSLTGAYFRAELERIIYCKKSTSLVTGYISRHSVINNQIRENIPSEQKTYEMI